MEFIIIIYKYLLHICIQKSKKVLKQIINNMLTRLLTFTLVVYITLNQQTPLNCQSFIGQRPQGTPIRYLQARAITLQNDGKPKNQNQFNITLKEGAIFSKYSIAVGISFIQNYFDSKQLDFSVRASASSSSFKLIYIISEATTWMTTHIHYLASSFSEVIAGNFIADNSQLLSFPTNSKNITLYYFMGKTNWGLQTQIIKVQAFISGIKCKDRSLNLFINSARVNLTDQTLKIDITFSNKDAPVEILLISYFFYTEINSQLYFAPYDNIIESLYRSWTVHPEYEMMGIKGINLTQSPSKTRLLGAIMTKTATMRNLQVSQLTKWNINFKISGFQIRSLKQLSFPAYTRSVNSARNQCKSHSECLRTNGTVYNNGKQVVCIYCTQNSKFNPQLKKCMCNQGYFQEANSDQSLRKCFFQCNPGDIYVNGQCYAPVDTSPFRKCPANFVQNYKGNCQCRSGYTRYFVGQQTKCAKPCANGEQFNQTIQKCICKSQIYAQGRCTFCLLPGAFYDLERGKCQCPKGQSRSFSVGRCQPCSANATYIQKSRQCKCNTPLIGDGTTCKEKPDMDKIIQSLRKQIKNSQYVTQSTTSFMPKS